MAEKVYKNRVKENYEKEVVPYLVKKFNYKNVNEVPKLVKIVINSGLGDLSIGLEMAGFKVIASYEADQKAVQSTVPI